MALRRTNRNPKAFDAAGSSGLAFLNSELEYADPNLVKPLTSFTHPRDITVKFGGGFLDFLTAYASDYASTGGNEYGLQGTNNSDVPLIQTNIRKGVWHAWNWAAAFVVSYLDLKKLETARRLGQPAPFSLNDLLDDGAKLVWNKALERVTYLGWLGQPGLINNPSVTSSLAPATGTGGTTTWSTKTPTQIQADINFGLLQTVTQGAYSLDSMADTILIPWDQYNTLMQPMTTGGFSSVLEFVANNNIARQNGIDLKIFPVANPWISTQGAGGTGRAVFYRNNEKNVMLRVPQPIIRAFSAIPSDDRGGSWKTILNGCIGQVQFLRTQPFRYLDGI